MIGYTEKDETPKNEKFVGIVGKMITRLQFIIIIMQAKQTYKCMDFYCRELLEFIYHYLLLFVWIVQFQLNFTSGDGGGIQKRNKKKRQINLLNIWM